MIIKKTFIFLIMILVSISFEVKASDVDTYQNHWIHKAVKLQRNIDLNVPLYQTLFQSTHNSYNSAAYTTIFRYIDPNQKYSLNDQLRMDVREIELDVHKYLSMQGWPWQWKTKLLLSHAEANHIGASAFDRTLEEGLAEISGWARKPENKNEVLIIDIEEHIDGQFAMAVSAFESYLGDLLYRPQNGCQGIPMNLSKIDVLKAGKHIILHSSGCKNNAWNKLVFTGVGDHEGFVQSKPDSFTPYPDCGCESGMSKMDYTFYMLRYYEDRTFISKTFSNPGKPITPDVIKEMVRCGVNIPSTDKLEPFDGRLQNTVWSWDTNEPVASTRYAAQKTNGRFSGFNADKNLPCACKNTETNEWYLTNASVTWQQAESTCNSETNGIFKFFAPVSGYDNQKLIEAKKAKGLETVWVNYFDTALNGNWITIR